MAAKTQMVTIPLEEYKELLLRERPDDRSAEICERMLDVVASCVEYDESYDRWNNGFIRDHMYAKNGNDAIKEIVIMLRYVDFERYMTLWNKCATKTREREAMEAQIEQMNQAKDIRSQRD